MSGGTNSRQWDVAAKFFGRLRAQGPVAVLARFCIALSKEMIGMRRMAHRFRGEMPVT